MCASSSSVFKLFSPDSNSIMQFPYSGLLIALLSWLLSEQQIDNEAYTNYAKK
jgi:hypothetical protein